MTRRSVPEIAHHFWFVTYLLLALSTSIASWTVVAEEPARSLADSKSASAERTSVELQLKAMFAQMPEAGKNGYEHLINNVYLPADFDREVALKLAAKTFDARAAANKSSEEDTSSERKGRRIRPSATATSQELAEAFWERFGLSGRPAIETALTNNGLLKSESAEAADASQLPPPLQYVVSQDGSYIMNCFACHGGKVDGVTYPGAPNNEYALQSLTEEVRATKIVLGKKLSHMDLGSAVMPLGTTRGSSNAVMFGVALMHFRDADLNVLDWKLGPKLTHHDMDPPPWWHFKKKHHIYIDGFAEKGHRGLMQFMLVRQNGPDKFRGWENEFREVYEFISNIQAPVYPYHIDQELAVQGEKLFVEHCSSCHGTYGKDSQYPELTIPLEEIGTDPVRFAALSVEHRAGYGASWFGHYGEQKTIADTEGYVAPPLDGVWASAPYLHNGSVPTLWHLLNPSERPAIWHRTSRQLDREKMGLSVEGVKEIPEKITAEQRREFFDTSVEGKSAKGHDFPDRLDSEGKKAVLEYLKTL
jgi:mono/diheme cytochrome c family protein